MIFELQFVLRGVSFLTLASLFLIEIDLVTIHIKGIKRDIYNINVLNIPKIDLLNT